MTERVTRYNLKVGDRVRLKRTGALGTVTHVTVRFVGVEGEGPLRIGADYLRSKLEKVAE